MASSSIKRRRDAVKRIHERLGLWPGRMFIPRSQRSSSSSFLLHSRPDLEPRQWSVGALESLSALAINFEQDQARPTSLAAQVALALIEAVDTRIKRQTRTGRSPAMPFLTPQDIEVVRHRDQHDGSTSSHEDEHYDEEEEDDDEIEVLEEREAEQPWDDGGDDSSEDQYTGEDEADSADDPESERPKASNNATQSADIPEKRSSAHANDMTNGRDQHIPSGNVANKSTLFTSPNMARASTTTASATAAVRTTNFEGTRTTNGASSSVIPNKRPRLNSYCSDHTQSANQASSSRVLPGLVNNDNEVAKTHVLDLASERHFVQQHYRLGGSSSSVIEDGELSAIQAIRQQSMRFEVTAAELQVRIFHQRTLNSADEDTVTKMQQCSDRTSERIWSFSRILTGRQHYTDRIALANENFGHAMDSISKDDATFVQPACLTNSIQALSDDVKQKVLDLEEIKIHIGSLQDRWRCFEHERAAATDRYERRAQVTADLVDQQKTAIKMKKHWELAAEIVQMTPDRLSHVMNNYSVAAGDLQETHMDLTQEDLGFTL